MKEFALGIALIIVCLGTTSCSSVEKEPADPVAETVMDKIAESHVEANVPKDSEFEKILKAELIRYFAQLHGTQLDISYELLRREPTQSGVAYPKYYLWALVKQSGVTKEEGAIRVAAIDQSSFEVTHFVPKKAIAANSADIESIFPAALIENIRDRAK